MYRIPDRVRLKQVNSMIDDTSGGNRLIKKLSENLHRLKTNI